ncbi:MAG: hypothetical protein V3T88_04530 [Nitrosomonadaceae bacterium]
MIFVTAIITERLLLSEFGDRAVATMDRLFEHYSDNAQKTINERLNTIFELLSYAEYNGITGILPPRRDHSRDSKTNSRRNEFTISRIKNTLKKTERVKILCISGTEFLGQTQAGEF